MAGNSNNAGLSDGRVHGTVYHKRDRRVNDIIRRCRKSEIINLFNIDCCMLFQVGAAHVQFDMLQNNRPYLLLDGTAEGVFLPAKLGLMFPNRCDQLDFRKDYEVASCITYALSDLEIATLANNGLFNNDWSCQGRLIGATLEIPCKIDYYAVANTPVTFIEIQDRLSLHTSTMMTGYKSLVATFLPYSAQKHNEERRGTIREGAKFDMSGSEIRRRGLYDTKAVGFQSDAAARTMSGGASFVEMAQARINARLKAQMEKADVLGVKPDANKAAATAEQVAKAVDDIRGQTDGSRKRAEKTASDIGTVTPPSVLDARLNDMQQRMVYAGAQSIPVQVAPVDAKPLVQPKPTGRNDEIMTTPTTDVSGEPAAPAAPAEGAETVKALDNRIHDSTIAAEKTASDIVSKALSRKEKLAARAAQRRAAADQQARAVAEAARDEESKGMTERDPDAVTKVTDEQGETQTAPKQGGEKKNLSGDAISQDVDFDKMLKDMGL